MTRKNNLRFLLTTFLLLFCAVSTDVKADEPPTAEMSPLFRMVGQDAGVCIEFSHLKQRVPQAAQAAFFQRLQKTQFYQSWKEGKRYQKFQEGLKQIEKETGKTAEELAAQLFGQSTVVAIYPSTEGEPKGLLLTEVQNTQSLQEMIAIWNRADRLQIEKRTYAGSHYYMKINDQNKDPKKEKVYYFYNKYLFALSDHEDVIRKVIDYSNIDHPKTAVESNNASTESLADSTEFQQMHASLSKESVIRLFINPRKWDNEVQAGKNSDEGEKAIVSLWRKCRSVSIGLQIKNGLVVEALVMWNRSALFEQWQQFVKATSGQSSILNKIPASAIIVACGQFDGTVFKLFFEAVTTEKDRNQLEPQYIIAQSLLLELDPFDDLLANLGTNWGAWLQPAEQQKAGDFFLDALFVTDLNNPRSTSKRKQEIPDALENLIITGLNGLTVIYNSQLKKNLKTKRAVLRRTKLGETVIRWVDTSSLYQLAVGISPELLFVSNSPLLIEQFATSTKPKSKLLVNSERFKKWSARYFAKHSELLYVDVVALRQLMESKQEFFKKQFERKAGTALSDAPKQHVAKQRFTRIQEVLTPIDVIFVAIRYLDDGIQLKIGAVAE